MSTVLGTVFLFCPDGAVALLVGTAISPLTEGDLAKAIIAGTWLAVFIGLILNMAAKFKLGVITEDFL